MKNKAVAKELLKIAKSLSATDKLIKHEKDYEVCMKHYNDLLQSMKEFKKNHRDEGMVTNLYIKCDDALTDFAQKFSKMGEEEVGNI